MDESIIKIKAGDISYYIDKAYASCRDFVCAVSHRFDAGEGEVLHAGRNELRSFVVGGKKLVVKRYKRVTMLQRVVYSFFRRTKAHRAFDYARIFRSRGIDTPHEVAYMEQREHGLFTIGYFVCEDCPHPPVFDELVESPDLDKPLADALVDCILSMHEKGILHGDLNLGNFLYDRCPDGSVHFTVIDINRSRFCDGMPSRRKCIENFTTITHRRDLYEYVVKRYAQLRGWNEDEVYVEALHNLERLEERNRKKEQLKQKLNK